MKAISLRPEWAMPVALGLKTVECRTWRTAHRGPLLVCASARPTDGCVHGMALAVVDLDGIEPFGARHLWDAYMDEMPPANSYAWRLSNPRLVEPFAVKGRLNLFDAEEPRVLGAPSRDLVERHVLPLVHRARNSAADEIWAGAYAELGW